MEPLTVALEDLPESHDGSSAFTVRLAFSDEVALDEAGLRAALLVSNGSVTGVSSVSVDLWDITITPAGNANVQLLLSPTSDCAATGTICTDDGRKLSTGVAVQIAGPPGLSVADAEVNENAGTPLAFAVTLDRAASGAVTVDYATSDETAAADYTAVSGTLTFAAGETAKTVTLAQHLGLRELVDHHVDLGETPGRANTGDKGADPGGLRPGRW